jgi:hypothetical protein
LADEDEGGEDELQELVQHALQVEALMGWEATNASAPAAASASVTATTMGSARSAVAASIGRQMGKSDQRLGLSGCWNAINTHPELDLREDPVVGRPATIATTRPFTRGAQLLAWVGADDRAGHL